MPDITINLSEEHIAELRGIDYSQVSAHTGVRTAINQVLDAAPKPAYVPEVGDHVRRVGGTAEYRVLAVDGEGVQVVRPNMAATRHGELVIDWCNVGQLIPWVRES